MIPEIITKENFIQKRSTAQNQKKAYRVTESIASRDNNNLYITSSFFQDRLKYEAFCAFYSVMRIVDDRIDNLPLTVKHNEKSQKIELDVVNAWEQIVIACSKGITPTNSQLDACNFPESYAVSESLIRAFKYFPVPIQLWINFFRAMRSDLSACELETWSDFLFYSEGATVAPTSIYLYLITARFNIQNNSYELPLGFDLFKCGYYLGLFAYLGHIIRDLAVDLKNEVKLCITSEDLRLHDVSLAILMGDALNGQASIKTKALVKDILQRAQNYLLHGRNYVTQVYDYLEHDGRFILELIISIYEQVIKKIESADYDSMSKKHMLSKKEKNKIIRAVSIKTGYKISFLGNGR